MTSLEKEAQFGCERKYSPFVVLRGPGIQSDFAGERVNLRPLKFEHFAGNAPSGERSARIPNTVLSLREDLVQFGMFVLQFNGLAGDEEVFDLCDFLQRIAISQHDVGDLSFRD